MLPSTFHVQVVTIVMFLRFREAGEADSSERRLLDGGESPHKEADGLLQENRLETNRATAPMRQTDSPHQ